MLYGLGVVLLFISTAFVGGSIVFPAIIALSGMVLMMVGKDKEVKDEKRTRV